jgi:predicted transcriptional regulator
MNFSIHLDEGTYRALAELARQSGRTRNAVIGAALREYLERNLKRDWSPEVREFLRGREGVSDFPPFESYRSELSAPTEVELE